MINHKFKNARFWLILLVFTGILFSFTFITMKYPSINSVAVSETYFGQTIEDKYRILENTNDPAVKKWIAEEKEIYDSVISKMPYIDSLKSKLGEVIYSSNELGGFPRSSHNKIFFNRTYLKEKIQKIFYKDSLTEKEVEIFSTKDINKDDKIYSIDFFEPSYDGKYLSLGLSPNGSELSIIKIINVATGSLLNETIERATYGTPFWVNGKDAFFYNQLRQTTPSDKNKSEDSKVKLHWLNTDPENDPEIFSRALNTNLSLEKIDFPIIYTFPRSKKAVALVYRGTNQYFSLFSCDLDVLLDKDKSLKSQWTRICSPSDMIKNFALNGDDLYVTRFKNNPNGVLEKYNIGKGLIEGNTIINGKDEVLDDIMITNTFLYSSRLKNGFSLMNKIELSTGNISEVQLPFKGFAKITSSFRTGHFYSNSNNLYYAIESWDKEVAVYSYNPLLKQNFKTDLRIQGKYGNASDLVIKEVEVPSHDGALVPLTIVHSKNIKLDSNNPTMMNAYGAYGFSINAAFSSTMLVWMRLGGVYAIAHVRGGGEKGEAWYKGGFKETKANSWKDFIACAEYLIKNKYTSTQKLAAKGGSAGGITVGRALTERPDLFKAVILNVGVLNALRFESSGNTANVSEFGTVSDPREFKYLKEMDVYNHITDNTKYPSILISASMNDRRVQWWQSGKAVARFQEVSSGKSNLVLFKITDDGHFGDANRVNTSAEEYSFLFSQLNYSPFN